MKVNNLALWLNGIYIWQPRKCQGFDPAAIIFFYDCVFLFKKHRSETAGEIKGKEERCRRVRERERKKERTK
jgi:hypothetical protein